MKEAAARAGGRFFRVVEREGALRFRSGVQVSPVAEGEISPGA